MRVQLLFFIFFPCFANAQHDIKLKIDSLQYVNDMPYICQGEPDNKTALSIGCGDYLFWNAVKLRERAIPYLISKLDDSMRTKAVVPNFGYFYTTADICYTVLQEIIRDIPTFRLLGIPFDEKGCGFCAYWQYLNKNMKHRKKFKRAVAAWYQKNKPQLVWVRSNLFSSCDCGGQHPNGGHYELKK
jgi:hypothetical protein